MPYRLSINENNIAAIGCEISNVQLLTKQGTKVLIAWSIMREMAKLVKVRPKIPAHLHHISAFIQQKQYDEVWQFDHEAGLVFQIDPARKCVLMLLGDGNCIEIDMTILFELKRRHLKTPYA